MATVFVSHSSKDDELAAGVEAWLKSNGFTDLFVDHSSISTGERWADALRASAGACRVVVCLVTENWLASPQCRGEFQAAWYMGKRIAPLFLLAAESELPEVSAAMLARVRSESQGLDLTVFRTDAGRLDFARDEVRADLLRKGLRAVGALAAVGLDPEAFEIDRSAQPMPFPGLMSFSDDDAHAALFYGRSREIAETLEELRAMRASSDRRPLVILGPSGAGKSSLLRAGVVPRLRREAPAWIPLQVFRPGADPLLNFAEAITRTLADFKLTEAHGTLRKSLFDSWRAAERNEGGDLSDQGRVVLRSVMKQLGERLRTASARPHATILISIDQAEEIARSVGESGDALGDYLRAAMDSGDTFRLAFTIRTDSFPELQNNRRFQGLEALGYDLRALPLFRFNDVVEAPAKRYGVAIDPALVDALMEDAPKEDALPLLAFAMQRLWDQFAAGRAIRAEDYRSMGGLAGLIEDAAERALCGIDPERRDTPLPVSGARKSQAELGARTFVPPLADVNDNGATIRRVAKWTDFDEEQQDLLTSLDRWRLVVRKGADSEGGTVEVAHEALFREWSRLAGWLEPERARLEALRGLQVAADTWQRHERAQEYLVHFGRRLVEARSLETAPRFAERIDDSMRAYLRKCRNREMSAAARRRVMYVVLAGLVLFSLAAGGVYLLQRARADLVFSLSDFSQRAENEREEADRARESARLTRYVNEGAENLGDRPLSAEDAARDYLFWGRATLESEVALRHRLSDQVERAAFFRAVVQLMDFERSGGFARADARALDPIRAQFLQAASDDSLRQLALAGIAYSRYHEALAWGLQANDCEQVLADVAQLAEPLPPRLLNVRGDCRRRLGQTELALRDYTTLLAAADWNSADAAELILLVEASDGLAFTTLASAQSAAQAPDPCRIQGLSVPAPGRNYSPAARAAMSCIALSVALRERLQQPRSQIAKSSEMLGFVYAHEGDIRRAFDHAQEVEQMGLLPGNELLRAWAANRVNAPDARVAAAEARQNLNFFNPSQMGFCELAAITRAEMYGEMRRLLPKSSREEPTC